MDKLHRALTYFLVEYHLFHYGDISGEDKLFYTQAADYLVECLEELYHNDKDGVLNG